MRIYRPSEQRGVSKFDWLESKHSFSFGEYYDPHNIGWGPLRVINDDLIAPKAGFPTHPHKDMEIFSYVTKGALAHKDSMGNEEQVGVGRIQLMSAGSGILHSEFNPSDTMEARLLQIWIQPEKMGLKPNYQDLRFDAAEHTNRWKLLMSPNADSGSVRIMQDANVFSAYLEAGQSISIPSSTNRKGYLHIVDGEVEDSNQKLKGGDAYALEDENAFRITAQIDSEILYFDLPNDNNHLI